MLSKLEAMLCDWRKEMNWLPNSILLGERSPATEAQKKPEQATP